MTRRDNSKVKHFRRTLLSVAILGGVGFQPVYAQEAGGGLEEDRIVEGNQRLEWGVGACAAGHTGGGEGCAVRAPRPPHSRNVSALQPCAFRAPWA